MIIKCILLVFALSYPPPLFILTQETGMLVSVVTLLGTELHIDDDAEIRLCDTSDKM
jgi:hypothetical protein